MHHPGAIVIKHFSLQFMNEPIKLDGRHFHTSLMFASKAHTRVEQLLGAPLYGTLLALPTCNRLEYMVRPVMDKPSKLFGPFKSYKGKVL